MNIVIDGKPLTIFARISILDLWDWRSEYDSGISKVTRNLKIKFTFYAKVQGKVNTYTKMKKSKHCKKDDGVLQEHVKNGLAKKLRQLLWNVPKNSCS